MLQLTRFSIVLHEGVQTFPGILWHSVRILEGHMGSFRQVASNPLDPGPELGGAAGSGLDLSMLQFTRQTHRHTILK